MVVDHAVTLVGLKPATKYALKVKSRDKHGNQTTGETLTFSTVADTTPPEIKDLKSESSVVADSNGNSKAQAIISWSTDEPATSQIKYAMGVAAADNYPLSTQEDINLTTSHVVIISNLELSQTYHLRILSKDASGNLSTSDDYTVLTQNQNKSLVQYIVQILEERFFWLRKFGIFE